MKKIDLSGNWKLLLDAEKKGLEKEYFKFSDFPMTIELPGSVSQQKKSPKTDERASGFLTDPYKFEGWAWYQKEIKLMDEDWGEADADSKAAAAKDKIADDKIAGVESAGTSGSSSFRLTLERTRYTTLWINGKQTGTNNSINGKQLYDFTLSPIEQKNPVLITILVSNTDYIVPGGHMTSPDTQTNWNGITGEISLEKLTSPRLENLKVKTLWNKQSRLFELEIKANVCDEKGSKTLNNDSGKDSGLYCHISVAGLLEKTVLITKNQPQNKTQNQLYAKFQMPVETSGWSDTNPKLYELKVSLFEEKLTAKNEAAKENESRNEAKTLSISGKPLWNTTMKIGFRQMYAEGTKLMVNGKKVFLRGKHDGLIFPETGFAPATVEEWKKVMGTAKEYGINHYRFHTSCPPEAAFTAADELGIYMAPELPFWGTIQAPGEEGFNQKQQDYLIKEGFEILDSFGNHPSFVMMSMGNELWGSEKRLDDIMKGYHDYDDRHLYTGGSNNFQFWPRTTEHEDYFSGVRFAKDALIRGSYAQCDAPLGFVQTDVPNTNHNYDVFFGNTSGAENNGTEAKEIEIQFGTGVKKVKAGGDAGHFIPGKPCISHEVGQYCMYPNFQENKRFTGVLKPYNFEIFQERLKAAGMEEQAADFFRDSSRLAVQCYKTEIEAALRSNELSGFQLLDIQDFTGQGTAVVGVLNAFMESKGVVSGEQWRSFCDQTVLLASFEKYVWEENQEFSAKIILHNYSDFDFAGDFVTAYIINTENDEILCEEQFDIPSENTAQKSVSSSTAAVSENFRGNTVLGTFKYKFEDIKNYKKLCLLLVLNPDNDKAPESIINSYTLHIYPKTDRRIVNALVELEQKGQSKIDGITLKKGFPEKDSCQKTSLNNGPNDSRIIYFPDNFDGKETVPGTYCTDFWCYPMFRSISESMKRPVPAGTLGLTIKNNEKEFIGFPTDSYTTPKWYNIISHSTCVNLFRENAESKVQTKASAEPLVQMIDNFERNWKLGILYRQNNALVCTSRLWEICEEPEVVCFVKSLIQSYNS